MLISAEEANMNNLRLPIEIALLFGLLASCFGVHDLVFNKYVDYRFNFFELFCLTLWNRRRIC